MADQNFDLTCCTVEQRSSASVSGFQTPVRVGVVAGDRLLADGLVELVNSIAALHCIGAWTTLSEDRVGSIGTGVDVLIVDWTATQVGDLEYVMAILKSSPETHLLPLVDMGADAPAPVVGPNQDLRDGPIGLAANRIWPVHKADGFAAIVASIRQMDASVRFGELSTQHDVIPASPANLHGHPGSALTVRERQVVDLIGLGCSNKEIAIKMQLGYSTVKNYVSTILEKLDMKGRTQVALAARQFEFRDEWTSGSRE